MPSHGHVNPTLGLVNELVKQGEEIVYFASPAFREKIEAAGAEFKSYNEDLDIFKMPAGKENGKPAGGLFAAIYRIIGKAPAIIDDILVQTERMKFSYLIHSAAFPFAKPMTQILGIPAVSSLAVFAGLRNFSGARFKNFPGAEEMMQNYREVAAKLERTYAIRMPENIMELLLNKTELNLVYTSKYFVPDAGFFDGSYKFAGPPVYTRKENLDFPFEQLRGKRVLYISLGTVFGSFNLSLYDLFFKSFAGWDGIVVMAAHNVGLSSFSIPDNFIIRDYVPQSALLPYTSAAITHAGMNSISDLISSQVPFVCIPLGADQPLLAKRAEELGATIALDAAGLDAEKLKEAVERVLRDPAYLQNIRKIDQSFREAGGYPKAVEEIFLFKRKKGII